MDIKEVVRKLEGYAFIGNDENCESLCNLLGWYEYHEMYSEELVEMVENEFRFWLEWFEKSCKIVENEITYTRTEKYLEFIDNEE